MAHALLPLILAWLCFATARVIRVAVCRYVYKGSDRAMVGLRPEAASDETVRHEDLRSFGAAEGAWRTLGHLMYSRSPAVRRLEVHLHNRQMELFEAGNEQAAVERGPRRTTLLAWLDYLREAAHRHERQALECTYAHFPRHYSYNELHRRWHPRRNLTRCIGRMHFVHPRAGERFYLRMLLHRCTGGELALREVRANDARAGEAQQDRFTLEALKWFAGVKHPTFHAACRARGMLQDDGEWHTLIGDQRVSSSWQQLQQLFEYVLRWSQPTDPQRLFDEHWHSMADPAWLRQYSEADCRARVLLALNERLLRNGSSLWDVNVLFTPEQRATAERHARAEAEAAQARVSSGVPALVRAQLHDDASRQRQWQQFCDALAQANAEQREFLEAVCDKLNAPEHTGFYAFFDAPGGTGKTFCFNAVLRYARAHGHIALATASTGIAALLLDDGATFHSTFSASRHPTPHDTLFVAPRDDRAELLRRTRIILVDEASGMWSYHIDALDRTLRDLMRDVDPSLANVPFGGKIVILGGVRCRTFARQAMPCCVPARPGEACCVHARQLRLSGRIRARRCRCDHEARVRRSCKSPWDTRSRGGM